MWGFFGRKARRMRNALVEADDVLQQAEIVSKLGHEVQTDPQIRNHPKVVALVAATDKLIRESKEAKKAIAAIL